MHAQMRHKRVTPKCTRARSVRTRMTREIHSVPARILSEDNLGATTKPAHTHIHTRAHAGGSGVTQSKFWDAEQGMSTDPHISSHITTTFSH